MRHFFISYIFSIICYIVTNAQSPSSSPSILSPTPTAAPTFSTLPIEGTAHGAATITMFEMIVQNQVVAAVSSGETVYFDYQPSLGSTVTIRMTFNWKWSSDLYCPDCMRQLLLGVENSHVNNACYKGHKPPTTEYGLTLSVSYTHDDTPRYISTGSHLEFGCIYLQDIIPSENIGFIWTLSADPTKTPSFTPSKVPTQPSFTPTKAPTQQPTVSTINPSFATLNPPGSPTRTSSRAPTTDPTSMPTIIPSTISPATYSNTGWNMTPITNSTQITQGNHPSESINPQDMAPRNQSAKVDIILIIFLSVIAMTLCILSIVLYHWFREWKSRANKAGNKPPIKRTVSASREEDENDNSRTGAQLQMVETDNKKERVSTDGSKIINVSAMMKGSAQMTRGKRANELDHQNAQQEGAVNRKQNPEQHRSTEGEQNNEVDDEEEDDDDDDSEDLWDRGPTTNDTTPCK